MGIAHAASMCHAGSGLKSTHLSLESAPGMFSARNLWIIDDDSDDHLLVQHALRDLGYRAKARFFENAEDAVNFLGNAAPGDLPHLILCDLKMPGMTGFDFLTWVRKSQFKAIPVIIRSNSSHQTDVTRAYNLGANAYNVKESTAKTMQEAFAILCQYWVDHCKTPLLAQ
jgi:CheY-like chemotaxis protein